MQNFLSFTVRVLDGPELEKIYVVFYLSRNAQILSLINSQLQLVVFNYEFI